MSDNVFVMMAVSLAEVNGVYSTAVEVLFVAVVKEVLLELRERHPEWADVRCMEDENGERLFRLRHKKQVALICAVQRLHMWG